MSLLCEVGVIMGLAPCDVKNLGGVAGAVGSTLGKRFLSSRALNQVEDDGDSRQDRGRFRIAREEVCLRQHCED